MQTILYVVRRGSSGLRPTPFAAAAQQGPLNSCRFTSEAAPSARGPRSERRRPRTSGSERVALGELRTENLEGVRLGGEASERLDSSLCGRQLGIPHEELLEGRSRRHDAYKERGGHNPQAVASVKKATVRPFASAVA